MTDVGPDVARPAESHLRVHVRAVHINLSAVFVHDLADPTHAFLEYAMGRRVGDHQSSQLFPMFLRLGFEVAQLYVAGAVARDRYNFHSGDDRACGIRSVSRGGYQAGVPLRLAALAMIGTDGHQPCVFAL